MASETSGRSRALLGGVVAGVVAGVVLAAFLAIMNAIGGRDVWMGAKGAGMPFLGERAAEPGFALVPVLVGVASHFAVSATWGVLFALVFHGLGKRATIAMGVLWGIVVWLGMYYVALPIFGLGEVALHVPVGQAILNHVLFGLVLGIAYVPFQRERRLRRELPVTP